MLAVNHAKLELHKANVGQLKQGTKIRKRFNKSKQTHQGWSEIDAWLE